MKVFVTGATGYAGFHTAIALRQAGHQVWGLVHDDSKPRAAELQRYEVQLAPGDVRKPETYQKYVEDSDVIIHVMMDFESPQASDRKLFNTLKTAATEKPRNRLFIYTTGCSIYGKKSEHIMDESTIANPEHALAFRMDLENELFSMSLPQTRRVVVRPGFMYGLDGQSSVTAMWFQMGEKGKAVFRGDKAKGWSWVHVGDLARAYVQIAETTGVLDREVFCLANEQRPTCLEVMQACLKAAGFEDEVSFEPPNEEDKLSAWFDQNEFITSRKAVSQLGWFPRHLGVIDEMDLHYMAWKSAQTS